MFFSPLYLRNDKRLNCEGARVMGYTEDQKYGSLGLASCCDSGPPPPPPPDPGGAAPCWAHHLGRNLSCTE